MESQPELISQARGQCARTLEHLREATVTATSAQGIVKVVYNGLGDGVHMSIRAGAQQRYDSFNMAGRMTSALSAADHALHALYKHALDDVSLGSQTLGEWREQRPDAASTVTDCFGGAPRGGIHE